MLVKPISVFKIDGGSRFIDPPATTWIFDSLTDPDFSVLNVDGMQINNAVCDGSSNPDIILANAEWVHLYNYMCFKLVYNVTNWTGGDNGRFRLVKDLQPNGDFTNVTNGDTYPSSYSVSWGPNTVYLQTGETGIDLYFAIGCTPTGGSFTMAVTSLEYYSIK